MRDYRKYEVWKKAHELCLFVYQHIAPKFPAEEKYGLTSQLKRAAYSVPLNIVEGCGRNSDKDFVHFLDMSLGSVNEVEYCMFLTTELNYLGQDVYQLAYARINEVKAMLINLIKTIRKQ